MEQIIIKNLSKSYGTLTVLKKCGSDFRPV